MKNMKNNVIEITLKYGFHDFIATVIVAIVTDAIEWAKKF